jgi:hypothetical protein
MSEEKLVRRRQTKRPSPAREFWRNYGVELVGLIVIVVGAFLLVERMDIRRSVAAWFHRFVGIGLAGFQTLDGQISRLLSSISVSDLLGLVLIVGAFTAVLLRIRWRLLNDPKLTDDGCPRCGGPIHRVHRKWYDRAISVYVPVRRYRCSDESCHWKGLKVGEHHGSGRRRLATAS